MLCERNDDVIYYTLLSLFIACIAACEKVSRHKHHSSINAACAQRGELACISEANVEICRQLVQQKKNIQSTYFGMTAISQNASGLFARYCTPSTLLVFKFCQTLHQTLIVVCDVTV